MSVCSVIDTDDFSRRVRARVHFLVMNLGIGLHLAIMLNFRIILSRFCKACVVWWEIDATNFDDSGCAFTTTLMY